MCVYCLESLPAFAPSIVPLLICFCFSISFLGTYLRELSLSDSKASQSPWMWNNLHDGIPSPALQQAAAAPVSFGKSKPHMLSLPAVKAVLYLNNEGNLEFMAKHREISPLHKSVLSLHQCQIPLLFRAVPAQKGSARAGYLLTALLAFLLLFWPWKYVLAVSVEHIWKADKFLSATFPERTHLK